MSLTGQGAGRLQATAAQEEQLLQAPASDLESEESSGEYETDSEDDTRQLLKPTFTQARRVHLQQPTHPFLSKPHAFVLSDSRAAKRGQALALAFGPLVDGQPATPGSRPEPDAGADWGG